MNKKKMFLTIVLFFLISIIILIPFFSYVFLVKDFKVIKFQDVVEFNFQEDINYDYGVVCYGNKYKCQKVDGKIINKINDEIVGEHIITYKYQYKNHTLTKDQIIKIVDREKPIIILDDKEYKVCPNTGVNINVSAIDNYDGNISDKVIQEIKNNEVIFTVKDSSGNVTIVTKPIEIIDNDVPILTLNGSNSIYVELNGTYKELGASAKDNCEGDLTENISIIGNVDTKKIGEYKITYTVTDKSGNKKSIIRKVYVYPKNNYETPTSKSIYLTFDDGPGPYTEKLLDILKIYNVPATFFVTNQSITKKYDNVIYRAYKEGHTIGLHTDTHNYNIYQSDDVYFRDLYAIQAKVERITGCKSTIIRFPGGSSNTISKRYDNGTKIMSELTKSVEEKGFRYWDWNISSGDAGETTSTSKVVSNVIKSLGNKSTYVVLQHDIKNFSVDAVEEIIIYGLSHGYTFRAITMETPTVHHNVNN